MGDGDRLRDAGDWAGAAEAYRRFLDHNPEHTAAWVQFGHAAKETGRVEDAVLAYRTATELTPNDADAHLQLGHGLKLSGEVEAAIAAYRRAFELNPLLVSARSELVSLGAEELPAIEFGGEAALYSLAAEIADLKAMAVKLERRLPQLDAFSAVPLLRHNDFRHAFEVVGDPGPAIETAFTVLIHAPEDNPAALGATLRSLMAQTHVAWTATVSAHADLQSDRAATYAHQDRRIVIADLGAPTPPPSSGLVMGLTAGVILDPRALSWFAAAVGRTGAVAAYADFDHSELGEDDRRRYFEPHLLAPFDIDALLQSDDLLQAPCFTAEAWAAAAPPPDAAWADRLRAAFLTARAMGPTAHIPRLLATRSARTVHATAAPAAWVAPGAVITPAPLDGAPVSRWTPARPTELISVIVPTRDRPDMLDPCIESLLQHASDPGSIEILVVDNGGRNPHAQSSLTAHEAEGRARVLRIDEPFNWSRLNNLAARQAKGGLLLFANDDVVMLTPGWDEALRGHVQRDQVGAVGARLVYPDQRLQHAGVCLSSDEAPRHEGLGEPVGESGPAARWARTRPVGAVTGAFLATRRDVFESLGGFDEVGMPIAFSDVDYCLKVRNSGRQVIYAPGLTLIHAESQSRGASYTARRREWEHEERAALRARWDAGMSWDPATNPYFRPSGRPVEALRAPRLEAVWEWIEASASEYPWSLGPKLGGR